MRTLVIVSLISLTGCFIDRPCATRPDDPLCRDVDGGHPPTDANGSNVDAGVTCVPPCVSGEVCDPTSRLCVGCLSSADCRMPAMAACAPDTQSCTPCSMSADCAHLTATPVCHMGTCVQCNTNDDCLRTQACDTAMHTCIPITPMSKQICDSCLRDSECQTGQLCVPISAMHASAGYFCAWRMDATMTGTDCTLVRPYAMPMSVTSVDGVVATMCLLRTSTCEAHHAFARPCTTASMTTPSAMCGGLLTGYCLHQGAVTECSVGCTTSIDCPCTDGSCAMQYQCSAGFCSLGSTCTWDATSRTCH